VTTGPDVMRSGAWAVLTCVIGLLWARFVHPAFVRAGLVENVGEGRGLYRRLRQVSYGVAALLGIGGSIAIVVGLAAWLTGTTFR
jgi:hypothetical protein